MVYDGEAHFDGKGMVTISVVEFNRLVLDRACPGSKCAPMQKKLATVLLRAIELYEESWDEKTGTYAKSRQQTVSEAWKQGFLPEEKPLPKEEKYWIALLNMMLSDALWNYSEDWAREVLA